MTYADKDLLYEADDDLCVYIDDVEPSLEHWSEKQAFVATIFYLSDLFLYENSQPQFLHKFA